MSISDFLDMMPDSVTLEDVASTDAYGALTYSAAVTYQARVSYKTKWMRRPEGSTFVSQGEVWLAGTPSPSLESRLTLPDGTQPPILIVERIATPEGINHTKITFGFAGTTRTMRGAF